MKTRYEEAKERMLNYPATRFALKAAIEAFDKMDPVDALNDAEALAGLMETRWDDLKKAGVA